MEMDYVQLLSRIHLGKHEFLDLLEWADIHIDTSTEHIYEWFIGKGEAMVMRFVDIWDCDWDTLEEQVYEFANMLDDEEEKDLQLV